MILRYSVLRQGSLLVLLATLAGCGSPPPPAAEPPPVSVSKPVVREIIDHDEYEGRIAAVETVEIRPRVRGHLAKVSFKEGEMVEKDALLFEIDPRPYKAALDAALGQKAVAEANLELAKKEYARVLSLLRAKAASQEEVDVWIAKEATATAERLKALAAVEQANLDLGFTRILAPISGKISRPLLTVGNLVNAGGGETLLTTIVTVDPVYVYFGVDERSLLRYRRDFNKGRKPTDPLPTIKELKIPIDVALDGDEGHPHRGVIDFTDNRVDPGTGTIQVRGVLPNPDQLFDSGMRAKVRVPVSDSHKVMMVTERAIGSEQGRKYVFVVNGQNVVERRDVELDRVTDGMQVIKNGLKADDEVIVNGIARVRDGMKVQPHPVPMPGAEKLTRTSKS